MSVTIYSKYESCTGNNSQSGRDKRVTYKSCEKCIRNAIGKFFFSVSLRKKDAHMRLT